MSGLYIHIPFCNQACHYCDFHFSTTQTYKKKMVEALSLEMGLNENYLSNKTLNSIYFGGGTPTTLSTDQFANLLGTVYNYFNPAKEIEITVEANPDDLTLEYLTELKNLGVNRLSIGIQSFNESFLKFLNRNHDSEKAKKSIEWARVAGFDNISIDLIYGIPSDNHSIFKKDLQSAIDLNTEHLSAYCLTIEEKTAFGKWVKSGKLKPSTDDFSAYQFEMLINKTEKYGLEQYEISNFCRNEAYSKHNSSYWKGCHYLGIGPGAHSYNGISRQFNISNNPLYLKSITNGSIPFTREKLSNLEKANDYILTTLRTKWGCSIKFLEDELKIDPTLLIKEVKKAEMSGLIVLEQDLIKLTKKGKLFADEITANLLLT